MKESPPVHRLVLDGIQKAYPGVQALKHGSVELRAGEVHALVGENGAGKSTLIKILAGALPADGGTIRLDDRPIAIRTPHDAQRFGIAVIHQELNLVPTLSARENFWLGQEQAPYGLLRHRWEAAETARLLAELGLQLDPETRCRDLSLGQQQLIEIAKALRQKARWLVMDEPTSSLAHRDVERLFQLIGDLRQRGLGILYVSHHLEEIFQLCDRVTVLRDGEHIATAPTGELSRERLIELMVGRPLDAEFPRRSAAIGDVALEVRHLTREPAVRDVSFSLRAGEILGITGLVGAGRTSLARLLFGADRADSGEIRIHGRPRRLPHPRDAIAAGICLLTEDRKSEGLVLRLSARMNFGLPNLPGFSRSGLLRESDEAAAFTRSASSLRLKVSHPGQLASQLSGGNQQKLVLGKWLQADSRILIFDEPTRGIDVGAKQEIYQLMNRLAEDGRSILMISSELPEVLGMSDRVLVMRQGRVCGELPHPRQTSQEQVMSLATG